MTTSWARDKYAEVRQVDPREPRNGRAVALQEEIKRTGRDIAYAIACSCRSTLVGVGTRRGLIDGITTFKRRHGRHHANVTVVYRDP